MLRDAADHRLHRRLMWSLARLSADNLARLHT